MIQLDMIMLNDTVRLDIFNILISKLDKCFI